MSPRQAAIAAGEKTYHGRPCKHCGRTERSLSNGCLACVNRRQREWAKANRPKRKATERKWRDANRERYRATQNAWNKTWYHANLEASRKRARAHSAKYRTANLEQVRERNRARYRSNREKDYLRTALKRARGNALRLGLPFEITSMDIAFPEDMRCPVLKIPLAIGNGRLEDGSPSIDRLDNSRGYIPGNVKLISWRANRLKSDASADELRAILTYLEGA